MTYQPYEQRKQLLIQALRERSGKSVGLAKNTSNLFRQREQGSTQKIDVRDFDHVLSVDAEKEVVVVEGMTTYEQLLDKTLKYGYMPAVVPQLKSITIGGAVAGGGIESSSFQYGYVHETVEELEILLGDGRIVTASKTNKHKDLLYGFPNSYGTLGYALLVTARIVPVKEFVHIVYKNYSNMDDYFSALAKFCRDGVYDFVDGVVFSKQEMYICLGTFVDTAPYTSAYTYSKVYYKSIRKRKEDFLTTYDYVWRWDADWFWCSSHFYMQQPVLRLLFGKFMLKSTAYWKLMHLNRKYKVTERLGMEEKSESVIQDVQIPINACTKFLTFFLEEIGITPVWICPSKSPTNEQFTLYKADPAMLYVNFGFWDTVPTTHPDGYYNRLIEEKVRALGGKKSLYSTSFYTKEEFDELYNGARYDELKAKYDPGNRFKTLFEKAVGRK